MGSFVLRGSKGVYGRFRSVDCSSRTSLLCLKDHKKCKLIHFGLLAGGCRFVPVGGTNGQTMKSILYVYCDGSSAFCLKTDSNVARVGLRSKGPTRMHRCDEVSNVGGSVIRNVLRSSSNYI